MHTVRTLQHSVLQVDLGAIDHNCTVIRNHIGNHCKLCAVVKADGYGLGAVRVISSLQNHADLLAVYSPEEAGTLVNRGLDTPLLILAPVHSVDRFNPIFKGLSEGVIQLVVHGKKHCEALQVMAARYGICISVQIKVDTGLHRGGCEMGDALSIIEAIQKSEYLELRGMMTHFVSAVHDEALTRTQHNRLEQIVQSLSTPLPSSFLIHEANTAAMVQWPWTHRSMVRVGHAWTGVVPNGVAPLEGLLPSVSWRTRLVHVKHVEMGEQVGYSGKWKAKRSSRIGIVPVGYAAGYPMQVGDEGKGSCTFVKVYDEHFETALGDAPVVGSICMDQIAIDLTDIPEKGIGCGIELISTDQESKANLQFISKVADVVPHAILSRISPTVHRTYLSSAVEGTDLSKESLCVS